MQEPVKPHDAASSRRHTVWEKLIVFLATGWGTGFFPKAPGTFASAAFFPVGYWFLHQIGWQIFLGLFTIPLIFMSAWLCERAAEIFKNEDPKEVVIDEWAGMSIVLLGASTWFEGILAFVLFRIFDIAKPGPVGYFDRNWKSGWGVTMDDVIAGIMGLALLLGGKWVYFNVL